MIYIETPRLILRSLEKTDLPRLVELLRVWGVVRWLASVPYPYQPYHADEFYARMCDAAGRGAPEYFLLQHKADKEQIGAIGLHPPREPVPQSDRLIIGYWLSQPYWRQGLLTEAMAPMLAHAFANPAIFNLTAYTDLDNIASQALLRKLGFTCLGAAPRRDARKPREAPSDMMCWQLTRHAFAERKIS